MTLFLKAPSAFSDLKFQFLSDLSQGPEMFYHRIIKDNLKKR